MSIEARDSANHRINNLWEKLSIGLLTLMLGWGQMQYQQDKAETKAEIKELNTKVLDLYRTSVTKQELREFEDRLTKEWSSIRDDVRGILKLYVDEGVRNRYQQ